MGGIVGIIAVGCGGKGADYVDELVSTPQSLGAASFSVSEGTSPKPWAINVAQGGVILSNGIAVISNFNERRLLAFDTLGHLVYTAAGPGQGPGEFRAGVSTLLPVGTGMGAFDLASRRFTVFRADGTYAFALSTLEWRAGRPVGWLDGDGLVLLDGRSEPGSPIRYIVADSTGSSLTELTSFPTPSQARVGGRLPDPECTPPLLAVTIGNTLYSIDSEKGMILAHRTAPNSATDTVYAEADRPAANPEMLEAIREYYLSTAPGSGAPGTLPASEQQKREYDAALEAYLARFGAPGFQLPLWSEVLADEPAGLLFLREAACGSFSGKSLGIWTVVDTGGAKIGRLASPARLEILDASDARLLAVRRDSLDVEHAEVYPLPPVLTGPQRPR